MLLRSLLRRLRVPILVLLFTMVAPVLADAILVSPHALFIRHEQGTGEMYLINQGDEAEEVDIAFQFGYPATDSLGGIGIRLIPDPPADAPSAADWLRAFPRRVRVEPGQPWTDQIVPPLFIPESKPLPALMHDLRTSGQHLAVVLDEYGGFSGVVSLEDALELVVGEIEDEFDQEKSGSLIQVEGGWSVPGHLSLRRLEVLLHRTIDEPAGVDSVGGLAAHLLGDGLRKGATAQQKDFQLTVEGIEDGRASRVIVTLIPPAAGHTT